MGDARDVDGAGHRALAACAALAGGTGALHAGVLAGSYPLLAAGLALTTTGVLALPTRAAAASLPASPRRPL